MTTARKVQKRSRKPDQSQEVASKKMKKSNQDHGPAQDVPPVVYKLQSLYRNGVALEIRSDEPHAEEVIEKIFTAFYKKVLPRLPLQQPDWDTMDSAGLLAFLDNFNAAAEKFKREKPRSILTAARWRKVHLDSDSFKEGHLITQLARMLSTVDERVLKKHYKSFSSETYGATTTQQMKNILDQLNVTKKDVIMDLGSGIGQLATFIVSYVDVKKTYGIEKCPRPAEIATRVSENFKRLMAFFGKVPSPYELIEGSFLTPENSELIKKEATIIFMNNLLFDNGLMDDLKKILHLCKSGTRIVVTKPLDMTRMTEKNFVEHFDSYSDTSDLDSIKCNMEWTEKTIPFWVTTMRHEKVFEKAAEYQAEKLKREAKEDARRLAKAEKAKPRTSS
ncbi:hypothetical protein B9Z55_026473 [Caenorhabditis nigoni]|uniref:Histone-lysine N-methyltransferase, H3 lysine-79 specific n=2 Tax=Caenorhabditis nigoni TaxID=1611254 RepID=A0A2G5T3T6_9PELO|nr:hypothetical protein B9Z55_026473 [Caenorhabditis nigoni]